MKQSSSGYATVDGGKLYYESGGEGETLVLCHAGFVDSGMWDAQWEALTQQYRVIRYDARGFGKSDLVSGSVNRRKDFRQLLDQLGVERAALLGSSMGGEMVIDFALEHPERVSALIVVGGTPSGFEMQGEPPRYMMEMFEAMQQGDIERASELQLRIWVDGQYREPEQVNAQVRQRAAAMNYPTVVNGTFAKADMQPLEPLDPPAVGRLGEVRVPALIMAGALDHPEILRASEVMASGIEGARKVILPDCAHVPNMEKPGAFNQAVVDFLGAI